MDMTSVDRPVSIDDLQAYTDDRLELERRQEVERWLATQPDLARRVAAYRSQRDGLRDALAPHAAAPVPPELNLTWLLEARLNRRPVWWRLAATVTLCLALGGAAGWYLAKLPQVAGIAAAESVLQQQAMASHAVFAGDQRHSVEADTADLGHLVQWLSNRLHRTVVPPDLAALGYRLLGGRLLATERGGAAALFVYDDGRGSRLSFLLRPMAPELRAAHADFSRGGVNGCSWISHGMGYAIVAAMTEQALDDVADRIGRQSVDPG